VIARWRKTTGMWGDTVTINHGRAGNYIVRTRHRGQARRQWNTTAGRNRGEARRLGRIERGAEPLGSRVPASG